MANFKEYITTSSEWSLGKTKKRRHKRHLILRNEDIKNLIENEKAYLR